MTLIPFPFSRCSFSHCDLLEPAIFFFIKSHTRNYCVITSDRTSVSVDISLSFINGTPPHHLLCFVLGLSWVYFFDQHRYSRQQNYVYLAHRGTKRDGRTGCFDWIPGQAMTFLPAFGSLEAVLSLKAIKHSGSHGTELMQQYLTIFAVFLSLITEYVCYGTTAGPTARGSLMSIHPGGWIALISQICGTVTGPVESGSNWTGSRQGHPSHVVSLSWSKGDWGEYCGNVLVIASSEIGLARGVWQTCNWTPIIDNHKNIIFLSIVRF